MTHNALRQIPSTTQLLGHATVGALVERFGHGPVVAGIRGLLTDLRHSLRRDDAAAELSLDALAQQLVARMQTAETPPLRPVINATGILLHTGLGRAPLAEEAIAAVVEVARQYASVELDLASGQRSRRVVAVESLLVELTGAEAALVVNNNAGATMIALAALAAGREVVVSRGQLVEIGGSYRLPDVMAASGAVLREVGTTNKTRLEDYAAAIGPQTSALLLVHPSNYVVMGFTESVPLEQLVELGRRHALPVIHDIGSGALLDLRGVGGQSEPLAAQSLVAGADVVLFSGDKLLGGPQCGIILGRRDLLARIDRHPLARALRVDKLTLAALAATLRLYRDAERAWRRVPLLALLAATSESLYERAVRLADRLAELRGIASAEITSETAYLGGGSIPEQGLPTWCVALEPRSMNVDALAAALRSGEPSVVGRVRQGRLLLDLRSVMPEQDDWIAPAVAAASDSID